jgi:hypothetical protein
MIYTLKQFIDLVHESDTMVLGAPNHTITKRKYSVMKRKSIQKRITEVELDKNGIPYEVIKQKLITKEVHDTNGITKLILDYLRYVYGSAVQYAGFQAKGKYRPRSWFYSKFKQRTFGYRRRNLRQVPFT